MKFHDNVLWCSFCFCFFLCSTWHFVVTCDQKTCCFLSSEKFSANTLVKYCLPSNLSILSLEVYQVIEIYCPCLTFHLHTILTLENNPFAHQVQTILPTYNFYNVILIAAPTVSWILCRNTEDVLSSGPCFSLQVSFALTLPPTPVVFRYD